MAEIYFWTDTSLLLTTAFNLENFNRHSDELICLVILFCPVRKSPGMAVKHYIKSSYIVPQINLAQDLDAAATRWGCKWLRGNK